jgi:hypothetical protein
MNTASVRRRVSGRKAHLFRRRAVAAVVGAGLISTLFAACARGVSFDDTGGGEGGGGPGSKIGSPCKSDADCSAGACTQVGANKYCSTACPPACPEGTYCSIIVGKPLCVPDLGQECAKCNIAQDCKMLSDECMKAPAGDTFCARDCTVLGDCPDGFTCMDKLTYAKGGESSDGGSGGPELPAGVPSKWCVPSSGASCPCDPKRDGAVRDCVSAGACPGTETCSGDTSTWESCVESKPAPEVCNKKDDDCNGQTDDGDPNVLCSSMGAKPPNAEWACEVGQCSVGKCKPGWSAYPPPALPTKGCACPLEMGEPNETCATALNVGSVSDTDDSALTIQGTLSSATDVDFWQFNTVDVNEVSTNSYHVSIDFEAPSPNDEFAMDVIRGNFCSETPTGPSVGITSYDWCVDGQAPGVGEAPCAPNLGGGQHCEDHSSPYYVRVSRKSGATGTCVPYVLKVTARGGEPCDFSHKCQ